SLAALLIFPQVFMRSFAYSGLTVVAVAMVGALIVLPALLAILGHRVDAFPILRRRAVPARESRWYHIAVIVMRRPILFATGVLTVLLLLGTPFLNVEFGGVDSRVLPADNPARIVGQDVRENFPSRESAAVTVVVPDRGDPAASRARIATYARELSTVSGVARVDAATGSYISGQRVAPNPASASHLSAEGTWLSVVPAVEPISPAAKTLVADLRAVDRPFEGVLIGGPSAMFVDSQQSLFRLLPVAIGMIATITFILLFLMFGSLFVPTKAILLNVLSLTAMYGAMVWVFQDGNLSDLLGFTATGTLDTSIPILMFCLAFGVSMDYEVFLLSRIKEEYDRTGDNTAAIAMGLARTGKIVTTAAVLLATVLAIFATSGVTLIKLFGVGLALAVLMDVTLIRLCLVPAVLKLAGQANWWLPHPLRRFHQRFKISELEAQYTVEATRDFAPRQELRLPSGKSVAMGIVGEFAVEHLSSPDAVAVLDETGQEKKDEYSAGMKRQYMGRAGQVTNAVNVVYCTYASPRGRAHVGSRLYLPKDWAGDPECRTRAGVGEDVVFQTKPQLAVDLLSDLDTAGVLPPWVASDEEYGRDTALRSFCEDRAVGYVLGVPSSFTVALNSHRKARANQALKLVQATAWNQASCGLGSTGDRTYAWAWITTTSPRHSLLVRRNLTDPPGQAYFYCYVPEGRTVTLGTLVRVAGMRWAVEEDSQVGRDQFGPDHRQARLHTPLICTLPSPLTGSDDEAPDDPGLIPLTATKVKRRLLTPAHPNPARTGPAPALSLVTTPPPSPPPLVPPPDPTPPRSRSGMIRSRSASAVRGLIMASYTGPSGKDRTRTTE
ncbi:MAG: IS701 family transposase, partial [Pseudonocardiaceae bacterium]